MRSTWLAIAFTGFAIASNAQTADAPAFEVATIKPSDESTPCRGSGLAISRKSFQHECGGQAVREAVTTGMLAKVLASQLTRSVEDMTGLEGVFDFTLEWAPDTTDVTAVHDRPSLFTAIREQLGLRLEPRQRDVDVVIIDHVDVVPTRN
jgi:uncharacterized protein (TIGR03435 family)